MRCACGGIILADTEDWNQPTCYKCYYALGMPEIEPIWHDFVECKKPGYHAVVVINALD